MSEVNESTGRVLVIAGCSNNQKNANIKTEKQTESQKQTEAEKESVTNAVKEAATEATSEAVTEASTEVTNPKEDISVLLLRKI